MRRYSSEATDLRWTQSSFFRREYELRSGTEVLATLKLHGLLGYRATVESADGAWSIERHGWCGDRVTIRERGQGSDLAEFLKNTWTQGGELTLASGAKFKAAMNFWMTRFDIRSVTSELVLRFERHGLWSHASDVRIFAKELPELPILVAFGWYLLVVLHDDAGAAMVIG